MKVEVKSIDRVWHAFFPDGTIIKSAGIMDMVEKVEKAWRPLERGWEISWEAKDTKFVVREVESKSKKISKSNRT